MYSLEERDTTMVPPMMLGYYLGWWICCEVAELLVYGNFNITCVVVEAHCDGLSVCFVAAISTLVVTFVCISSCHLAVAPAGGILGVPLGCWRWGGERVAVAYCLVQLDYLGCRLAVGRSAYALGSRTVSFCLDMLPPSRAFALRQCEVRAPVP
ncbi:hypothetical protein Nepgr_006556 [Nepenthes gracilis]|uniref:Transmembrane protein n=1 Tax=Nepenthes gracilis TaxID=150966 RepID=A0AAD3S5S3_NEPGR|nr:hypothetical protein Nepgr_006556 [Nepenthes gracilis]